MLLPKLTQHAASHMAVRKTVGSNQAAAVLRVSNGNAMNINEELRRSPKPLVTCSCTSSATGSSPPEHQHSTQPQAAPASDASDAPDDNKKQPLNDLGFTETELILLASAVDKAFLKIGSAGAKDTHCNSLRQQLDDHKLVKVQLNDAKAINAKSEIVQRLKEATGAHVLRAGNRTLLFGQGTLGRDELLSLAKDKAAELREKKQKKAALRQQAAQAREAASAYIAAGNKGDANTSTSSNTGRGTNPRPGRGSTAGGRGGRAGGSVDDFIRKHTTDGPLTRDTLRKEWESMSREDNTQFDAAVSELSAEARRERTGQRRLSGTPGAFGRPEGGRGSTGRGAGRSSGRGGRGYGRGADWDSGRGGRGGGRGAGRSSSRGGRGGGRSFGQRRENFSEDQ